MSNTEIVWGEPPKSRGGRTGGVWEKRLAPLKNKPGAWARVYLGTVSTARSTAGALRANDDYAGFEFASRKIDEETGGVWARWTGEEAEVEESFEDDDDYSFDDEDDDEVVYEEVGV